VSLEDRSFAGPTAVGRYWIAHAEGFAVVSSAGRALGRVESVAVDSRTAETMLVLARSPLIGRRQNVVPARRVASVLPWSQRLVLARASKASSTAPAKARSGERLRRVALLLRAAADRSRPPALAALTAGARGTRRAALAAEQALRLFPGVAAAVAVAAARALKAYAIWLSLAVPPLVRGTRSRLVLVVRFAARQLTRAVGAVRNDARSLPRLSLRR